jgi:hypothetical protein
MAWNPFSSKIFPRNPRTKGFKSRFAIITLLAECGRFLVLTAASMKITVFWDVAACCLVETDRRFRGVYCLHHHGESQHPRRQSSPSLVNPSHISVLFVVYLTTLSVVHTILRRITRIMNWKGYGRKRSWPNLRCYSSIRLEGLRKTRTSVRIAGLGPRF